MPRPREVVSFVIRWSGLPRLVRRTVARRKASILMYHDPDPAVLERHLAYLARRYTFVSLSELVEAIRGGRMEQLPRRALALTFDDGHRGNARLRALFERYGVKPTIYACSQIVGTNRHYWFMETRDAEPLKALPNGERLRRLEQLTGYTPDRSYEERHALSGDEMNQLESTVEFGAHSRFHPVLTTCDERECETEIALSKAEIESVLGVECKHFSYPNGDYGPREIELLRQAGYASARSTHIGWNDAGTDVFALKILGTEDDATVNRLATDLSGIGGFLARARQGSFNGRHKPVTS